MIINSLCVPFPDPGAPKITIFNIIKALYINSINPIQPPYRYPCMNGQAHHNPNHGPL
ncbi:hypothetical protein EVA_15617 [gut metagenome]|uniref:Uncharacterized protein n=1 Tax=gut metagenome TaxID=749906 RepID=J9G390_9ZZZZ